MSYLFVYLASVFVCVWFFKTDIKEIFKNKINMMPAIIISAIFLMPFLNTIIAVCLLAILVYDATYELRSYKRNQK